ncbi:MAG: DNA mismatch repair protein MutS [Nitrospirae bacterium]|nr:DNA mismatch repair protein MutS [Nitrospirota bacterium]
MPKDFTNRPFDKLKKQLERQPPPAPAPPSPPVPVAGPFTEDELFACAMTDVQVIEAFRVLPCARSSRREAPTRETRDPDDDALAILMQIAEGSHPINLSDTQEYIEWTNPGVPGEVIGKLHTGHFSVQGYLDLHGYTGDEVNETLDAFLAEAFQRDWKCVKVIHGRGLRSVKGPVLKDAVVRRLVGRYRKQVIAFVSARQCDGGLGAMYVLLRK